MQQITPRATSANSQLVSCITCRNLVPIAHTDLTGTGYRCSPCSHLGVDHASAHLSTEERAAMYNVHRRNWFLWLGASAIAAIILVSTAFSFLEVMQTRAELAQMNPTSLHLAELDREAAPSILGIAARAIGVGLFLCYAVARGSNASDGMRFIEAEEGSSAG